VCDVLEVEWRGDEVAGVRFVGRLSLVVAIHGSWARIIAIGVVRSLFSDLLSNGK
jgi:hypothetical protein